MNRRTFFQTTALGTAGFAVSATLPNHVFAETPKGVTTDNFEPNGRWTAEKARAWEAAQPWIVGCNYVPTYAINQLEMWQRETFNAKIIDAELALAAKTGMNTVRVFMHHLLWREQRDVFIANVRTFLDLCEKHSLRVIWTFFTNGGKEPSVLGPQPAPKPFTHNSEWRQTPGKTEIMHKPENWHQMEDYVTDMMTEFRNDPRVLVWDLFNEPFNSGDRWHTLGFLRLLWTWARKVNPAAPLTSAVQRIEYTPIASFLLENSDIVSFHSYESKEVIEERLKIMREYRRPIICKEWLARGRKCTVFDILPLFKKYGVGAINWGLIPGKLQTHYPWGWNESKGEPKVWHHDLYHEDHTPYDPKEIELFLKLTQENNQR